MSNFKEEGRDLCRDGVLLDDESKGLSPSISAWYAGFFSRDKALKGVIWRK
jgi:hypothetical protein